MVSDFEAAVERSYAGQGGVIVAGLLASVGPPAHDVLLRRMQDAKTRPAICHGISLPGASADAKALLFAAPLSGRDDAACVDAVLALAANDDAALAWLASHGEPGLLTAAAKGDLNCTRLATVWEKGLLERAADTHASLIVPLKFAAQRCSRELDSILAHLLLKAPRARMCITQALDPYSGEWSDLRQTCAALRERWALGETASTRERVEDALAHGCRFVR
jgi:hypothetical protein